MRSMLILTTAVTLGLCTWPALADDPSIPQIIARADIAAKETSAISYEAKVWGEGALADHHTIAATVKAMARPGGDGGGTPLPLFAAQGKITPKDESKGETIRFHTVLGQKQAMTLDAEHKQALIGDLPDGYDLVAQAERLLMMHEFILSDPFGDEMKARQRVYEGKKEIGGVECHVILIDYDVTNSRARWYFSVADGLPRRVDRFATHPQTKETAVQVLELHKLNPKPKFDEATFAIKAPEGYEVKPYSRQKSETQPAAATEETTADEKEEKQEPEKPIEVNSEGLLEIGTPAPEFALKTPEGKEVKLSDLRGKIVVLDFWATWCKPCKEAMPGLQKLHEHYKDKPVEIYGITVWEQEDPAAYMKEQKYTYGLLLKGDALARPYKLGGIPVMYVIDQEGKIALGAIGFKPQHEDAIKQTVDRLLKKGGKKP